MRRSRKGGVARRVMKGCFGLCMCVGGVMRVLEAACVGESRQYKALEGGF